MPSKQRIRKPDSPCSRVCHHLSYKDKSALANLLKMINHKLLEYLNPAADVGGMLKDDSRQQGYSMKRWHKQPWLAAREAKRRGAKNRKAI
jgi:hypothetical protein